MKSKTSLPAHVRKPLLALRRDLHIAVNQLSEILVKDAEIQGQPPKRTIARPGPRQAQFTARSRSPEMLRAQEVADLLDLAVPTVYERARIDPESIGAVHIGRSVRFQRVVIERIVSGENPW